MIKASVRIRRKLKEKHNVDWYEVEEAFLNGSGSYLEDSRDSHKTIPPTLWFISYTNKGRVLKIIFMERESGDL